MSTIKVNSIKNASTDDGGIAIDNTGHVQIDGQQLPTAGALSNRNLIINGAMQVSQRGDSTGVTSTDYYGPDRYRFINNTGTYSISQSTTAPEGFSNSWKLDCTTAGSLSTGGIVLLQQRIEAQNVQHLKYGTSSAVNLTASFWIRSNKTGVVTVEFYQPDDVREIAKTITINAANTWEYKTVTIPGDTTGVIDSNNDRGLELLFWFGAGTDFTSGTHNTSAWATANNTSNRVSSSNIDISDSTANELYLTGVQLEVGEKATPFEHRSFGDELQRCERYFQTYGPIFGLVFSNYTASVGYGGLPLRTEMRTNPTVYHLEAFNSSHLNYYSANAARTLTSFTLNLGRTHMLQFAVGGTLGTQGYAAHLDINQNDAIQIQAEL